MAGEKTIRLNMELPVSELAGVTALLEQLRQLMTDQRQIIPAAAPTEQSTSFDPTRFQTLQQSEADVTASPARIESETAALPTASEAESSILSSPPQPEAAAVTVSADPAPPEAPTINGELSIAAEAAELPSEAQSAAELPASAVPAFSELSEAVSPKYAADTNAFQSEQPSAHPVTAETLSMAFRRDDRRYDNGFPLY